VLKAVFFIFDFVPDKLFIGNEDPLSRYLIA
jgi:hypothetical protein